jgi:hypothetical protein
MRDWHTSRSAAGLSFMMVQHGVLGLDEWQATYCNGATNSAVGASDGAAHRERGTQRGSIEDLR